MINTSGKVIYENPESYMMYPTEKEGLFSFWKGKSLYEEWSAEEKSCKGLVDITSDTILIKPDKYQDAFRYSEGFWLTAMYPTKSMIIPTYLLDGEWVEAFPDKTFHMAEPFSEGLAAVAIFGKNTGTVQNKTIEEWGYMDSEGTMLESDLFLGSGSSFKEGLAGIYDDQRLVFINTSGEEVFEIKRHGNFMFSKEVFQEGFAPIATKSSSIGPYGRIGFRRIKGMSWGYMDKKGDFIVPPIFQDAFPVTGGMAVVQYAGNYGVIYLK